MILTTFSEKSRCATTESNYKGGSAGFFNQLSPQSIHSCRASLNSRGARLGNILNTYSRLFSISHSPAFDTSLDSNLTKLKEGYK